MHNAIDRMKKVKTAYIPFGKNVDNLLAHNEGSIVGDTGDSDAVLGYGKLAVVEKLDYAEKPGVPGYGDVEHEQPVEEEVEGEDGEHDGGGELEPWYA